MPKQKSELSITKRVLLNYIKFRTNNNFVFHEGNEYIAKVLGLMPNSAKVFVNELVRDGYLFKEIDKQGRRVLSYTGKEYLRLYEDMRNVDKTILKQERNEAIEENKYLNQQLQFEQGHNEQLTTENTKLVLSNAQLTEKVRDLEERLSNLEKRMGAVEKFFVDTGVGKEKLEEIIKNNMN